MEITSFALNNFAPENFLGGAKFVTMNTPQKFQECRFRLHYESVLWRTQQLDYSLLISRAHHLITEYYEAPTRYETNRWAQCRRQSFPCLPSIPAWRCILESKSPRWYWWVQYDRHYPRFSPTVGKVNQIESCKKSHNWASHKGINTEISCKVFESTLKWS